MAIALIGGGARSGKSRFALERARQCDPPFTFVATAQPGDEEMKARIARHRTERGVDFATIEEPLDIAGVIERTNAGAMVIDCLTLWLSNLMFASRDINDAAENLASAAARSRATVILVTNEVGCGIVPEHPLAREFRDRAGWLNQRMGALTDELYWMVFGHPLRVK